MNYIGNLLINFSATSTAVSSSAPAVFNTEEVVLQNMIDNALWAVLIGILLAIVILAVRGTKVKNVI